MTYNKSTDENRGHSHSLYCNIEAISRGRYENIRFKEEKLRNRSQHLTVYIIIVSKVPMQYRLCQLSTLDKLFIKRSSLLR